MQRGASKVSLAASDVAAALAALESEGFARRGHFTPGAEAEEWCERRLLARIDRYTVKRLRAERIEPVAVRDLSSRAGRWSRRAPDQ
jgi:ATP-dependent helicase Lhr and Lhr-like helicase